MKKKHTYRPLDVHAVSLDALLELFALGATITVALDVAKRKFLCALASAAGDVELLFRFEHPTTTGVFLTLLEQLVAEGRRVEVVMEPTGTYGDSIRYQLGLRGIDVYRVDTKQVHDMGEFYDRVPSKHDAKDACIIAWLHAQGRSTRWHERPESQRRMRALLAQREIFDVPFRQLLGQIEALLSRHFPELEEHFHLGDSKTVYALLKDYPSPKELGQIDIEELVGTLSRLRRRAPNREAAAKLLEAARRSQGEAMVAEERELVRAMASQALVLLEQRREVDKRIEEATNDEPEVNALRSVLGPITASAIIAHMGSPSAYKSAAAFEKAIGLNLRENSSGTRLGTRRISKRGPGKVRKYLFLTAMLLVKRDPVVKAWYQARQAYQGGNKLKALVAVMRKLARALVPVAHGEAFDATKLFDTRRLNLEAEVTA